MERDNDSGIAIMGTDDEPTLIPDRGHNEHDTKPGFALRASPSEYSQALLEIRGSRGKTDSISAAVNLLSAATGWRWAAVARMVSCSKCAQMMALSERGETRFGHTYGLPGTPCEVVTQSQGPVYFEDLQARFPDEIEVTQMGVTSYLGLCYRVEGDQLANVVLMHDGSEGACDHAEALALLSQTCLFVGGVLELVVLESALLSTRVASETDVLTGLPNRRAFDRELAIQDEMVLAGSRGDAMLLLLDVDGLKAVNDSRGHAAGDELLALVGRAIRSSLREGEDQVFRLGGDEFAVLIDAPGSETADVLELRIAEWNAAIARGGFPEAGISHGIALHSEVSGGRDQWVSLADARMYKVKRVRKLLNANNGQVDDPRSRVSERRGAARRIRRVA